MAATATGSVVLLLGTLLLSFHRRRSLIFMEFDLPRNGASRQRAASYGGHLLRARRRRARCGSY